MEFLIWGKHARVWAARRDKKGREVHPDYLMTKLVNKIAYFGSLTMDFTSEEICERNEAWRRL